MTRVGVWLLLLIALLGAAAPWIAVHPPDQQHRAYVFAPPMRPHGVGGPGSPLTVFYYPLRSEDLTLRKFTADRDRPTPLTWLREGRLVAGDPQAPWFPLGTDSLGRDIWSRLVHGTRVSMGVASLATLGAILLGTLVGAAAAGFGGWIDESLMRTADLVLVLPTLYVVLALRAAMPLVLPPATLFVLLVLVLAVAGAPQVARGVRGIVTAEQVRDYATAARALGATRLRVLGRHLLPATGDFLLTQALVLAPSFVLAEATLSFVGLGFNPPTASWGSMLQEATSVRAISDFPWVLAPAAAVALVAFALTLASEPRRNREPSLRG
jgi:peptide/nickel transport system permease protein